MNNKSKICFVLNAHLPYVKHEENSKKIYQRWFFDALTETYLPLLHVLLKLKNDKVPYKINISFSSTFLSMLKDEQLLNEYVDHLDQLIIFSKEELKRTKGTEEEQVASFYHQFFSRKKTNFLNKYNKNLIKVFDDLEKAGYINILTSTATYNFLPFFQDEPLMNRVQFNIAREYHYKIFKRYPKGAFLPSCGYYEGVEYILDEQHLAYSFLDSSAISKLEYESPYAYYAPINIENSYHQSFINDTKGYQMIWDKENGYPSHDSYRDFYYDIGFALENHQINPYFYENDRKICTGFKYQNKVGKIYSRELAKKQIQKDAQDFIKLYEEKAKVIENEIDREALFNMSFDAELFGHWWFEGPLWIEAVLRGISKTNTLETIFPHDYLKKYPKNPILKPHYSSWGYDNYGSVWLDNTNRWIYRLLQEIINDFFDLYRRYNGDFGTRNRFLTQALKEILLVQSSDWAFIMANGSTVSYAVKRVKEHILRFREIFSSALGKKLDVKYLVNLEKEQEFLLDLDSNLIQFIEKKEM